MLEAERESGHDHEKQPEGMTIIMRYALLAGALALSSALSVHAAQSAPRNVR